METRKYRSPLGGDISTSKANKGNGWKDLKGQAALALAVSLWIAGGSMASANVYIDANDNIVKGSISGTATAVPGIGNLASDKILTLTGDLSLGEYWGGFGDGIEVNGYQLILDNANISYSYTIGGKSTAANNAENNVVKIKNSDVAWVLGGLSSHGNAKKNTVELINSTAVTVIGGRGNGGYATDNSVYMTDSKVTETVQGGESGNAVIDKVSGNTLYLAGANTIGGNVSNFEKIYITEAKFGTPALILNGSIQNNPTIDTQGITFTGVDALNAGQKTILIQNNMTNYPAEKILSGKYKVGSTLEGLGKASISDDDLIYTIDTGVGMTAQEQTHNTVMGAEASMAALSAGNDFVGAAADGLSLGSNAGADGVSTFAQMGGGSMRQETGSHVTSHLWNAILALGHQNEKKSGTTEYGAFFEYGTGNYTTFNGDIRGDGSMHYTGGGFLGKWTSPKKDYFEGSIRLGRINDDATNVLTDDAGNAYGYNTKANYYGLHVGYGKIFDYSGGRSLDVYGKFFYNHRNGVSFDAGGHYDLDAINSQILRLGARYSMKTSDQWKWYSGLAYEYEFGGEATGTADGVAIRGASTKGGSLRAEVGATITQADSPWTVDLNLTAFAGKKRGLTGGVGLKYNF